VTNALDVILRHEHTDYILGISYIDSSKGSRSTVSDVHDIRTFPGLAGTAEWKMPSRIAYSDENESCASNQIGFQVTSRMVSYSWTKLLLDQNAQATEYDDPYLKKIEGDGMLRLPRKKTATVVVTDFLKEIYQWLVAHLAKRISSGILDATPMEFWFTVPAIWSDLAKNRMIAAATAAGFASRHGDRLFLIPEPEAAGVATLKGLTEGGSVPKTTPGDGVLICDCGGGTVDITSYKVMQVSPKLELEELVEGIGGKCGSTYIDREFHGWMSRTFGTLFDNLRFEKIGPGSRFMKDFESCKRDFGHSNDLDREYEINLVIPGAPDSAFYDSEESIVKLVG
jgi:hypothetical protein